MKDIRFKNNLRGQGIERAEEMKRKKVTKRTVGTEISESAERIREEDRYRMEEDENSIYEYDLGCLNEKRKWTGTKEL